MTQIKFAVLLALLSPFGAQSDVLYESSGGRKTFQPGASLALSSGWLIRDYRPTLPSATQFAAMPFTLTQDAIISGAELALTALADWSKVYKLQVLPDASGVPGFAPIWSASNLQSAPFFTPGQSYSFTSATGSEAELFANMQYWLYLACIANCELTWWADTSNTSPGAIQYNSVFPYDLRWTLSNSNAAMFRVTGQVSAVPEPTAATLLLAGLILGIFLKRRDA